MAQQKTFMGDFKRFFGRGLGILLPSVLTLWILYQLLLFLNNNVGEPINRGVRILFIEVYPRLVDEDRLPTWFRVAQDEIDGARAAKVIPRVSELSDAAVRDLLRREKLRQLWRQHWYLQATGLVLAIVIIYFAGRFLGGYLGRQVYDRLESLLARVPGFKQVYPHVKQVVQMILGDKPIAFNRVVLVEYPGKDIWTVGLVTGPSMSSNSTQAGGEVVTVFIPTTPTPFTGFAINVRRDAVLDLPMSVEEAFRFFVTGGVLVPEHLANRPAEQPARVAEAARRMAVAGSLTPPPAKGSAAGDAPGGAPRDKGV